MQIISRNGLWEGPPTGWPNNHRPPDILDLEALGRDISPARWSPSSLRDRCVCPGERAVQLARMQRRPGATDLHTAAFPCPGIARLWQHNCHQLGPTYTIIKQWQAQLSQENKIFVSSCLKHNLSLSFLNSKVEAGSEGTVSPPLNKKRCHCRKRLNHLKIVHWFYHTH